MVLTCNLYNLNILMVLLAYNFDWLNSINDHTFAKTD